MPAQPATTPQHAASTSGQDQPGPAASAAARQLAATAHGPYDDTATTAAAALAAEAIRYLCYAAPQGGITEPATLYTVTAELSAACYRLPQLMTQLADWLTAETGAGRIADDHHRPAWQLTDTTRDILDQAAQHAAALATTLAAAQDLTATLHATSPTAA